MRSISAGIIFLATVSTAVASDYEEVRDLAVDASGIDALIIDVGAGSLDVVGVNGLDTVEVKATIVIADDDSEEARKIIEEDLVLTLERAGNSVELTSDFDDSFWNFGSSGRVDLEVRAPSTLAVTIDDGSGSIDISDFSGKVVIDDGSGSIDVRNVGPLKIDDGSGSIDVRGAAGDVVVVDGSGSISIEAVEGTVKIDDGSGSIRVTDVAQDLIIIDDGSGSLSHSGVRGTVEQEG